MWRQRTAITLILLGVTSGAFADPPAGKAAQKPKALTAEEAAHEEHPGGTQQQAAVKAMQGALQRANRDQRRQRLHQQLQVRLRGRESSAPMRMELRNHARRTSRLQRIRQLAVSTEPAQLPRIDALITRETARHDARMESLIARANAAGPGRSDDHEADDEVEE